MNTKKLIIVLNFVSLAVGCLFGACIYNYKCFRCSSNLFIFQFLNACGYGPLFLMFFICLAILVKEEIPYNVGCMISFISAMSYFVASALMLYIYLKDDNTLRMLLGLVASSTFVGIQLCVFIMNLVGRGK